VILAIIFMNSTGAMAGAKNMAKTIVNLTIC
jgi:hypothetical protein